jgi:HK97 gp10 family phage protein
MPMTARTTGFPEMQGELVLLQQAVRTDATRKSVRAGAEVILGAIEERTPLLDSKTAASTALEPGALKQDMHIKFDRTDTLGFMRAWIGPNLCGNVAYWVEFGHFLVKGGSFSLKRGKLQGEGHRVGEVKAHPFIRPAYEASERPAFFAFAEELKRQLRKWVA